MSDPAHRAIPPLAGPPRLLVVVDAEETFDWSKPFDRNATDTKAMSEIGRGQELCENAGLAPSYMVDYPVASDRPAMERLARYAKDGAATIGAHLHSWVCPPFEEDVNSFNSYQGNLPYSLEREKLAALCRRIEESAGIVPVVHKAGRYGFGWGTAETLTRLGISVDLSPTPGFDLTGDGGPNYENDSNAPRWIGAGRDLLCIPGTGGFVGLLKQFGPSVRTLTEARLGRTVRAGGILARLGFLQRIRLSPEGFTLDEMKLLTRSLLRQGEKVFTLTYHSPSLDIGGTPYVRDKQDRENFLKTIERYLEFFFDELEGRPTAPLELLAEIRALETTGPQ